jgi:hypothetical protein
MKRGKSGKSKFVARINAQMNNSKDDKQNVANACIGIT